MTVISIYMVVKLASKVAMYYLAPLLTGWMALEAIAYFKNLKRD